MSARSKSQQGDRENLQRVSAKLAGPADSRILQTASGESGPAAKGLGTIARSFPLPLVALDGRNIYSPTKMRELGFTCFSIGRK